MKLLYFKRLILLLDDFFAAKTVFKKKTKNRFTDGEHFLIFYHSKHTETVRMYVFDLKTNQHIQTHYYSFRGYKRCFAHIKTDIRKLIRDNDRF